TCAGGQMSTSDVRPLPAVVSRSLLPLLSGARARKPRGLSQELQDVLTRLDWTFQACFHPAQASAKPSSPRFQGPGRSHSFTSKQFGTGASLDTDSFVCSRIRRSAVRWSRPLVGGPTTVTRLRKVEGRYISSSCVQVPREPLVPTGRGGETGSDVCLRVNVVTAGGDAVENSRHYRRAKQRLAKAQRRIARRK